MKDDRYGTSEYSRAALAPGLLCGIVLLAGLALIGGDWFVGVRYAVSILAIILCIMCVQAGAGWWLIALVPIAVIWNPVWPLSLDAIWWRLGGLAAAIAVIAAGISIRTPLKNERDTSRGRR